LHRAIRAWPAARQRHLRHRFSCRPRARRGRHVGVTHEYTSVSLEWVDMIGCWRLTACTGVKPDAVIVTAPPTSEVPGVFPLELHSTRRCPSRTRGAGNSRLHFISLHLLRQPHIQTPLLHAGEPALRLLRLPLLTVNF
jgi:hypothetical protein